MTSWWPSWPSTRYNTESLEEEKMQKKRLCAILRYVASMHEDKSSSNPRFVRSCDDNIDLNNDFFQNEQDNNVEDTPEVLFSTNDFRKLIGLGDANNYFSFYANGEEDSQGKRHGSGNGWWLRLKRFAPSSVLQKPNYNNHILQQYLSEWLQNWPKTVNSVEDLLTIQNIEDAPEIHSNHQQIKTFLRRYKKYLQSKLYQKILEPIYNSLFEFNQKKNDNDDELVWGFGHAKRSLNDGRIIKGPIIQILVEVELASDGSILIRPREHTGVTLNREVVAALVPSDEVSAQYTVSKLHQTVGNMDASTICPGEPLTYVSFLKRFAVELSPGGSFQESSTAITSKSKKINKSKQSGKSSNLVVSEAWCLYARSKPSSISARDANILADKISFSQEPVPIATWSLTHGPSKLQQVVDGRKSRKQNGGITNVTTWIHSNFLKGANADGGGGENGKIKSTKPIFPLATSDSQDSVSDLLLRQNYPAVNLEGPPGTGKTHVIANIVSAYLCEGKRVLVTSKNANALSVLRGRLPKSIQELVVDVSSSEVSGMRQLQKTVESLANRISVTNTDIEIERCFLLQRSIDEIENQLKDIDNQMSSKSERVRKLIQQPDGMEMIEKANDLIATGPWLAETLPRISLEDLKSLVNKLKMLVVESDDCIDFVTGFHSPPSNGVFSLVLAKSGSPIPFISQATITAFTSIPIVGAMLDNPQRHEDLENIRINDSKPQSKDDWKVVARALKHSLAVNRFEETTWRPMIRKYKWPILSFYDQKNVKGTIELVTLALELKKLHLILDVKNEIKAIAKCRELDETRTRLTTHKHHHSEELCDASVVAELSRRFSPDAQSALIRFAQIAAAAKFSKSTKKMSQRQRRRRQEYLDAFDRCCRFIPCWILTTSQISDYLPPECLFDLVIIDESSQSDITALPAMMRGKQWLVVGDGKQVSPTEGFVAEAVINNLRATLPHSPLEDAFLPGRSFFDLCAQAFPKSRVVLHEHFRCNPEIIEFSNKQFYDGKLVPLRLPTKLERFVPSLLDIRVVGGEKIGKVNENEADKIVTMIRDLMMEMSESNAKPRTIGVITLIGDEQSRLIRRRLLDSCGPELFARHDVMIGEPPQFQGAERDVIFLSMICSKRNCPTQNQQFHFQRANVALSRARDRMVLVRSIELRDISSLDDVKFAIIEFFMGKVQCEATRLVENGDCYHKQHHAGRTILKSKLISKGYHLVDMGVIWKNGLCVEQKENSDTRVAIMVDCEESQKSEWLSSFSQQKAIERVGWKCLRVDALSIIVDNRTVVNNVTQFLTANGIDAPHLTVVNDKDLIGVNKKEIYNNEKKMKPEVIEIEHDDISISSEDDGKNDREADNVRPDHTRSTFIDLNPDESIDATKFGEVVNLDFLRERSEHVADTDDECTIDFPNAKACCEFSQKRRAQDDMNIGAVETIDIETTDELNQSEGAMHTDTDNSNTMNSSRKEKTRRKIETEEIDFDDSRFDDRQLGTVNVSQDRHFDNSIRSSVSSSRSKKRRRIDKYSRDGRWYPSIENVDVDDPDVEGDWNDTNSDIPSNENNDSKRSVGDSTEKGKSESK